MNYNLGRILPIYRGTYEVGTTYNKLDIVYVSGYGSYVAKQTVASVQPQDNPEIWQLVAADCTNEELVETFNANEAEREQIINNFILSKSQELSALIEEVNNEVNAKLSEVDSKMQAINTEWGGMKNSMNNQFNAAQTERENTFIANEQQRENTLNTAITNIENSDTAFKNSLQNETSEWLNEKEVEFNEAQTERATEFNSTITSMNGQFNAAQANRTTTFNNSESDRATTFSTNETARQNTFNTNEDARQDEFDSKEAARDEATQAIINEHDYLVALDNTKANKDGYYSTLTAGAAENLVGDSVDSDTYLIRPTGGQSNEVANGVASVIELEGNSCVWNQLVKNPNFDGTTNWASAGATISAQSNTLTWTAADSTLYNNISTNIDFVNGHKFFVRFWIKGEQSAEVTFAVGTAAGGGSGPNVSYGTTWQKISAIASPISSSTTLLYIRPNISGLTGVVAYFKDIVCIDLTLLGIDNLTTVTQVEAWLAQHVGTKPYYEYNEGTVLSAKTTGFNTYGQNILNPTTKQATLIPYTWEDNSNVYTIKNIPTEATITYTPDNTGTLETITITNNEFDITQYGSGVLEFSDVNTDSYVCMKWDGSMDDEIVPYEEHNYNFDVTKVYGKVNGEGEYIQCFPDGMRSASQLYRDKLTGASAEVRCGYDDLGGFIEDYYIIVNAELGVVAVAVPSKLRPDNNNTVGNIIVEGYVSNKGQYYASSEMPNYIAEENTSNIRWIMLRNPLFVNKTRSEVKSLLNGIHAIYRLETTITYTNLIYRDNNTDTPLTDSLLQIDVDNWSMEQQTVQTNSLPTKVSAIYGLNAVEAIDTLQKSTYTETDIYNNLSTLLACINTNCVTVLGGTFSISDTATDKVFTFTFTPNEEGEGQ